MSFSVDQLNRHYSQTPPELGTLRTYMNPTESFEAFTPGIPGSRPPGIPPRPIPIHISKNDDLRYESVSGQHGNIFTNRNTQLRIPIETQGTVRFREINPQDLIKGGKKRKCRRSRKSRRSRKRK